MSTSKFGNIFSLAESPLKQGMIYAGTDDGLIWITENDGSNWTRYDSFTSVPDTTLVNYILPSMHDTNTVYACFDGRKNDSDFKAYLIKSTDKGKSWNSIATDLPSGTVYVIQEDHENPNILFIGTEWGVWTSIDGGKNWVQIKKGIPTIQIKDLTIQRRDNDLVVATFGRGIYILNDYSPLRQLSESIANKEAHIFDIDDSYLFYPARSISNQGEVYYRSENPKPSATFRYFIKDKFVSLKKERVKAQKTALKDESEYPYPSEEELLAESQEKKPSLMFTIYDSNGLVMRKISASAKDGYGLLNWDLSYLNKRGPKVPPGFYNVALDIISDSKLRRLVEPVSFEVFTLPNALGEPDYAANFEFMKDVADLSALVSSARGKIKDMNTRLKNINDNLESMPVEADFMLPKLDSTQQQINNVAKVIVGGFGAKNTVSSRLGFASYASSFAQVPITGSQKEQLLLAREAYESQENNLNDLHNITLPSLEQEFLNAGGILFKSPPRR